MKAIHTALVTHLFVGALVGAAFAPTACVPTGSAPPYDAGAPPVAAASFRPSLNVMAGPFEESFDRPDSGETATWAALALEGGAGAGDGGNGANGATPRTDGGEAGTAAEGGLLSTFLKDGGQSAESPYAPTPVDRGNLGPNWVQIKTSAWRVENGKLCGQGAHNHPIWLNRTLPVNARIEFDATSYSDEGDLKTEVWGDGASYATGTSYTNATSYLAILGGWKNTIHAVARLNEHGPDRKEIHVDKDSDDPRQRPVQKGQTYHFKVERNDGKTVRWSVDGIDFLTFVDASPLAGQGHDHFGFNEWEAKVCFDNVKVTPL